MGRMVVVLAIACLVPLGALVQGPYTMAEAVEDPFEDRNGLLWAPVIKVTENDLDDKYASVRVDKDGHANIVYLQSGAEYMWAEIGPPTNILTTEKRLRTGYIPTQYQVKNESTPQPTEFFDIGPDGNIHVVWTEAGLLDNRYQRFDEEGEPVTPVIPMNQITDLSRLPYIVVGENGRAYIAFENEGTAWVQMTYVDDKGYIKAPSLVGRPGENVAYAMDHDGDLHLFYRSLGADVSLFHVKMDPDRHPLVPNSVLFPNTSKIANPYSSMPTITITSDGHVHLLISDTTIAPHPIYYIELDDQGIPIRNFTKVVDAAYNYGDIVGDPDNGVYVFWDDWQDGEIHYTLLSDGAPGEDVTVTSTGGKARFPQVISDRERGDIHLTFVDSSDGDGEIFYRYANGYRIGLEVSGLEEAMEVHPGGGDIVLDLTISNIGDVPNKVILTASVDHHGLEDHGWAFDLATTTLDLAPGDKGTVQAILKGPTGGQEGESIEVTISAVPERCAAKGRTLTFNSTLTITHSISLTGPPRMALMTDVTSIHLGLRNDGDLEEEVNLSLSGVPKGWDIGLDTYDITMPPKEASVDLTMAVDLPDWIGSDTVVPITLTGRTATEKPALAEIVVVLVTYPTVFPMMTTDVQSLEIAPGGEAVMNATLWNRGLSEATFAIGPRVVHTNGEWDISLGTGEIVLAAGANETFEIRLRAPDKGIAGQGIVLKVVAVEERGLVQEEVTVQATIRTVEDLGIDGGGEAMVFPGETAVFDVVIVNNGNSERELELSVLSLPTGWRWQFGDGTGLSVITVAPFSGLMVDLLVTPPIDAPPGNERVLGTVECEGEVHHIDAMVKVLQVYGTHVTSPIPITKAMLGSEVSFTVQMTNMGTSMETYDLHTGDLPSGVTSSFMFDSTPVTEIQVRPGETEEVQLVIAIPYGMRATDFQFWAGAGSETGEIARTDLFVEFRLADLRVKDVVLDDKDISPGDTRKVTVRLANSGDADAVEAPVNINGKLEKVTIPAGGEANLTVKVTFDPYDTGLLVVVDPGNDIQERREDNNAYFQKVDVKQEGKGLIPGFEGGVLLMVLGTVAMALFLVDRKRS